MKKALCSVGILVCFGLMAMAQEPSKPVAPPNPNAPEVVFAETSHDFATLQKGDDCSYEFKFKNTGKEPLIISNCQASCGCTTPSCPKEPIAPGASGMIKVKYDSNRVGVFTKTVTVTSNAKNSPITLSIKGKIDGPAQEEAFPGKNNGGMGQ